MAFLGRTRLWLVRGLRISTIITAIAAIWLAMVTPASRIWIDAGADLIEARVARVLETEFDQDWLDSTLKEEILKPQINWVLVDSTMEIARSKKMIPSPNIVKGLEIVNRRDRGTLGKIDNCRACAMGESSCRMADGMVCAIGIELTPIGDARALIEEGHHYVNGEEVDQISVTLAGVGLGATMAILVSGGSSLTVKSGAGLLKIARRAGRLTTRMQATLVRLGRNIIKWDKLPSSPRRMLDPAAYRAAINMPVATSAAALAADLNKTRKAMPLAHSITMLQYMDTAGDARRIGKVSTLAGSKTVAFLRRVGKTRVLRMTARFSRTARTMIGLVGVLVAQALALMAALFQARLIRWIKPARA